VRAGSAASLDGRGHIRGLDELLGCPEWWEIILDHVHIQAASILAEMPGCQLISASNATMVRLRSP
jgi:hypothetical protein